MGVLQNSSTLPIQRGNEDLFWKPRSLWADTQKLLWADTQKLFFCSKFGTSITGFKIPGILALAQIFPGILEEPQEPGSPATLTYIVSLPGF